MASFNSDVSHYQRVYPVIHILLPCSKRRAAVLLWRAPLCGVASVRWTASGTPKRWGHTLLGGDVYRRARRLKSLLEIQSSSPKSIEIHGNRWKSKEIYRNPSKCTEIIRNLYGNQSVEIHPFIPMFIPMFWHFSHGPIKSSVPGHAGGWWHAESRGQGPLAMMISMVKSWWNIGKHGWIWCWMVVWNIFSCFQILGMSSSQLTNIFQMGF